MVVEDLRSGPLNHRTLDPLPPGRIRVTTLSSGTDEVRLERGILQDSTLRGQLSCFSRWPEPFDSLRSLRALDSSEGRRPRAKSAERTSRAGEGQRVRGTYTQPETGSFQGGMSSG